MTAAAHLPLKVAARVVRHAPAEELQDAEARTVTVVIAHGVDAVVKAEERGRGPRQPAVRVARALVPVLAAVRAGAHLVPKGVDAPALFRKRAALPLAVANKIPAAQGLAISAPLDLPPLLSRPHPSEQMVWRAERKVTRRWG